MWIEEIEIMIYKKDHESHHEENMSAIMTIKEDMIDERNVKISMIHEMAMKMTQDFEKLRKGEREEKKDYMRTTIEHTELKISVGVEVKTMIEHTKGKTGVVEEKTQDMTIDMRKIVNHGIVTVTN